MPVVGKEKVTWMKLTTKPLDKEKNFSKVKRALCSFPQVQDQIFDEKSKETVTIKVVCCSPEKVADKLCSKGGGVIKTIEFDIDNPMALKPKAPEKPKEAEKPKPAPAASSSQTMIYNSEPGYPMYDGFCSMLQGAHPMYNGYPSRPIHDSYGAQPMYNGYPSRSIHDSYGGGDWYRKETGSYCTIL